MSPGVLDDDIDVGVVVVTYQSAVVVGPLLASLDAGLAGLDWQALFVDNASDDGTAGMIRTAGFDVVSMEVNRGYAAAINAGLRRFPRSRSVLVLNPDVRLMPGSVAAMVEVLHDEAVGVVAPMTRLTDEHATLDLTQRRDPSAVRTWAAALLGGSLSRRLAMSEEVGEPGRYETSRDVDWAVGAVLLIGRACLDAVGDWDESFFLYSEETDFCRRARRAGFAVRYTPTACVHHVGGGGHLDSRLRSMMVVNKVRDYRRWHGAVASWCFFAGNLFRELTRAVAGRPGSRAAALALLSPSRRPPEVHAGTSVMPR